MRVDSFKKNLLLTTGFGLCAALVSGGGSAAFAQTAEPPAAPAAGTEAPPAEDPQAAPAAAETPPASEAPGAGTDTAVEGSGPLIGWQFEGGVFAGIHLFGKDLEFGVPDLRGEVDHPQTLNFVGGLRLGVNYLPWVGLELEGGYIPTKSYHDGRIANVLAYRANGLFYILHGKVRPFLLGGVGFASIVSTHGYTQVDDFGILRFYGLPQKDTDFEGHFGAGVKFDVSRWLDIRVDGRIVLMPNTKDQGITPDWEFTAGLGFKAGGHYAVPPAPPIPPDADGDGIPDNVDKCPNEPEDADQFEDEDGCPDLDNDKDGIPDTADKCPTEAETKNGIDDEDGCPERDEDNDGIVGSADKCPTEAEDKDGFEDEDGCPDLDNDKDGVPDATDKCPMQPETKNGFQDSDGCPDEVPAEVKKFTGVIPGINFKKNSADIQRSSFKILTQAVSVLKNYPDTRIEISGHTSSEGKREHNIELSKARADSVKQYLVSAGIDASRVETVGYGPDKPIALNKTKKGREQNRRIEFRLLTADDAGGSAAPGDARPLEK